MLVNFSFYIQKFHDIDAEYRLILTTYDETTYCRNIIKEGFLYSNGRIVNKDQVVLDLPTNDSNIIKNYFEIYVTATQTSRTKFTKPIKINLLRLEVNNVVVKSYLKKHIIHNAGVNQDQTGLIIPDYATISMLIPGAIVCRDSEYYIQNYDFEFNNTKLWDDGNNPIKLNNEYNKDQTNG